MKRIVTAASVLLVLAGCETVSQMTATGGSRSDGIVKLSFEAGMFDSVQIDEDSALATARGRCRTWGYSDAEAFGGNTRQCQAWSSLGCARWFVTREYQCTSNTAYSAPPPGYAPGAPPMSYGPPPPSPARSGGVKLVPAHTASGYCIEAPPGYVGSGSTARPAVTSGMPLC